MSINTLLTPAWLAKEAIFIAKKRGFFGRPVMVAFEDELPGYWTKASESWARDESPLLLVFRDPSISLLEPDAASRLLSGMVDRALAAEQPGGEA